MKLCKNHFKPNCILIFYIDLGVGNAVVNSKNLDSLDVGDTLIFTNRKYSDRNLTNFIGDNIVDYAIVGNRGNNVYDVISTRRLIFDGKGSVITDGNSLMEIRIKSGKLASLSIRNSQIAVVGGTGKFLGARGEYTNKDVGSNVYSGELKLKL